jgi:hypothetical protein
MRNNPTKATKIYLICMSIFGLVCRNKDYPGYDKSACISYPHAYDWYCLLPYSNMPLESLIYRSRTGLFSLRDLGLCTATNYNTFD